MRSAANALRFGVNGRLRTLGADLFSTRRCCRMCQRKAVGPARRRALVDEIWAGWKVSIHSTGRVLRTDTSTITTRANALRRPGWPGGSKKVRRHGFGMAIAPSPCCCGAKGGGPCQAELSALQGMGPATRTKTPKRRVKAKRRDDRRPAVQANETWAMDFVHDQLATGRPGNARLGVETTTRFAHTAQSAASLRSRL